MAIRASGASAIALTGYNLAGQTEYVYPSLVSNPHPSADGSYFAYNPMTNAVMQDQSGGFGGATGSAVWKYNVVSIP